MNRGWGWLIISVFLRKALFLSHSFFCDTVLYDLSYLFWPGAHEGDREETLGAVVIIVQTIPSPSYPSIPSHLSLIYLNQKSHEPNYLISLLRKKKKEREKEGKERKCRYNNNNTSFDIVLLPAFHVFFPSCALIEKAKSKKYHTNDNRGFMRNI